MFSVLLPQVLVPKLRGAVLGSATISEALLTDLLVRIRHSVELLQQSCASLTILYGGWCEHSELKRLVPVAFLSVCDLGCVLTLSKLVTAASCCLVFFGRES